MKIKLNLTADFEPMALCENAGLEPPVPYDEWLTLEGDAKEAADRKFCEDNQNRIDAYFQDSLDCSIDVCDLRLPVSPNYRYQPGPTEEWPSGCRRKCPFPLAREENPRTPFYK